MLTQFQDFDRPYLDRLRSGDFTTQQHFFAYFGELIRIKAARRLRSSVSIEDIRQETFTRVLCGLAEQRIRHPERLGAFVNSVCTNVLREQYRSSFREIPAAEGFADTIPDPALDASDALAQRQLQQEVRRILAELSEKDRTLMKALFIDERDKDEICQDFGVDREYLRVLVHRAKLSFKSRYLKSKRARGSRARVMPFRAHRPHDGREALAPVNTSAFSRHSKYAFSSDEN